MSLDTCEQHHHEVGVLNKECHLIKLSDTEPSSPRFSRLERIGIRYSIQFTKGCYDEKGNWQS